MENSEDYIYISRNIIYDPVWDFHRTPKGTGGVFLYIAQLFHRKHETVTLDMNNLNRLKKPSANKEFRNSFKWLIINGYIKCKTTRQSSKIEISLTEKSTSLVKFHKEDCNE